MAVPTKKLMALSLLRQRLTLDPLSAPSQVPVKRPAKPLGGWPTSEVASVLADYLSMRLGVSDLRYLSKPLPICEGWESYIYHFQLEPSDGLPPGYQQPLTLRVFWTAQGVPRARHEFAVLHHMRRLGYPVPAAIALDESCNLFGGPFMLIEQIPGPRLLDLSLRRPWKIFSVACEMAEAHAALHQLPAHGFPAPPKPMLQRSLNELRLLAHDYALGGLEPGLDWLLAHQPAPPAAPSILHMDFHPLNLMHDPARGGVVIDWTEGDVGDPHADIAVFMMLIECTPAPHPTPWELLATWIGRPLLLGLYLRAYRRQYPIDGDKLTYYRAWAALRQLARCGRWLCAGPQATGAKPELLCHISPCYIQSMCRYFEKHTGVALHLEVT
jgi:aminoglycoside phosphotransferase (APT) family kinase protein